MEEELEKLVTCLRAANTNIISFFETKYPVYAVCKFYLSENQSTPTYGTIIGHDGGEYAKIRVKMHTRKESIRDISAKNIIWEGK